MSKTLRPRILAIRSGKEQTQCREHGQALFLTNSFMFKSAQQSAALFAKEIKGFIYTRTANPTIATFEQRISTLESAECSVATSTGTSAIQASFFTFLKVGDHVVPSRSLFGTTAGFISNIMTEFGIGVSYVPRTDLSEWRVTVKENTKPLFLEIPLNPLNGVADLKALSEVARTAGVLLVVDNSFLSPVGRQPLKHGADISVQSATKAIDGHDRVMSDVLSGSEELTTQVAMYCNSCDLAMSPFNAWVLLNGVETLSVRMEEQFADVLGIARWLSEQPQTEAVYYSSLPGHSQAVLAARQQLGDGIVVGFGVDGKDAVWSLLDKTGLFSKTTNLGGVRSTVTHPWTTTHGRMSPEDKQAAGIQPDPLHLATGLEYPDDLITDLQQAVA